MLPTARPAGQQSQQRWLGQRLYGGAASEYLSTLARSASGNWQEIAPALGEVTRKQWQAQLEASQALTRRARGTGRAGGRLERGHERLAA